MTTESSATMPTADFGTRFSAFVIDAALLFSAQWVIFIVLSRQLQAAGMTTTKQCDDTTAALCEGPSTLLWALLLLFLLASTVGYHAVFEGRYGATPGKRWMGLAVVDISGQSPIGLPAGVLRSVVRQSFWLSLFFVLDASPLSVGLPAILFLLVPLLALSVFVIGAVNPTGQAGHDMIALTFVVRTDQLDTDPLLAWLADSDLDSSPPPDVPATPDVLAPDPTIQRRKSPQQQQPPPPPPPPSTTKPQKSSHD